MELKRIKYIFICSLFLIACKHEPYLVTGDYPANISKIIQTNCAITGCHNNKSYEGAGGLNLTTWNNMFAGGNIGTCVIPYRSDFSTLCYYTNTDTNLGVTLEPTMPVNASPLSQSDYLALRNWILNGAPNSQGKIKFADDPTRSKIYVTNKLCDVVTVFDTKTLLQMRYIDVGNRPTEEFPHYIQVSPDKKNWYVSFFVPSSTIQKFDATDDIFVSDINIGDGVWTSFTITHDSKYGFFVDNQAKGRVAYVNLETGKLIATYEFGDSVRYPQGIIVNESSTKLYIGSTLGNYIYSVDISNPTEPILKTLSIDGSNVIKQNSVLDPLELVLGENDICFAACSKSHEIRAIDMNTDAIIASIDVGSNPAYIDYSKAKKKLFVTCPDDRASFPGNRGSVVIVNTETYIVDKRIDAGYQPYGVAVDDKSGVVAIVNANFAPGGDEPHHSSNCDGKNGNVTFIDLNTLELVPGIKSEVAVYPYTAAAR
ncbi:MAG: hypothetical protein KDC11_03470 [Chitinophagaceae bacterium]|nr:hypothetical protein [Chitinophagaceae bacterium]